MNYNDLIRSLDDESEWYATTDFNLSILLHQAATAIVELTYQVENITNMKDKAIHRLESIMLETHCEFSCPLCSNVQCNGTCENPK